MTWTCPREGCELGIDGHDLALVIEHIYGGVPTKDGGTFDEQDARDVADRVSRRWGWLE